MTQNQRSDYLWNTITYTVVGVFVAMSLGPLVWLFLTSFKSEADIITAKGIVYIPRSLTFENYIDLWRQTQFPALYANTAVTAVATVLICLVAGVPAAYALSHAEFWGKRRLLLGLLAVRAFPAIMLVIPLFIIMRSIGLLDTRIGLAIAYSSFLLPIFIWLMKCFFDASPREFEESARVDGCTRLQALWHIGLPLVRQGILAAGVLVAISAANEFLFALILTNSTGSRTWPVGLQLMIGDFQLPWGMLAAGGVISILPIFSVFALVQSSALRDLAEASVKRGAW